MSRTDLDPAALASALRRMAGDSSVEWVMEPIQASVLLDVADALDENAELRELVRAAWRCIHTGASCSDCRLIAGGCTLQTAMRELGVEV